MRRPVYLGACIYTSRYPAEIQHASHIIVEEVVHSNCAPYSNHYSASSHLSGGTIHCQICLRTRLLVYYSLAHLSKM